ncbi:MAG: DUF5693 family protein [Fervidobacterium sp.]
MKFPVFSKNENYLNILILIFSFILLASMFLRIPIDRNNLSVFVTFVNNKHILFFTGKEEINDDVLIVIPIAEMDETKIKIDEFYKKINGRYVGNLEFYGNTKFVREFYQKTVYKKILKVHYIKPQEIERYNTYSLYKRLWRAIVERSVEVIILPDSEMSKEALEIFANFFSVSNRIPEPDNTNWNTKFFSILLGIFVSLQFPMAIFSFLFFKTQWLFITIVSILGTIACYYSTKSNFTRLVNFFILGALTNFSLYSFSYLNDLEVYRGVKVSLILLPLVILLNTIFSYIKTFKASKKEYYTHRKEKLTKLEMLVFITLSVLVLFYVVLRSGNYGFVTRFEENLRLTLENIFIIRPRIKELLLIPILLLSKEITNEKFKKLFELLGSLALISIFNSFCHIKAPIFVVFYRETVTIIVGIVLYTIIYIFGKLVNIWTGKA